MLARISVRRTRGALNPLSVPCRVIPPTRRMRCTHFGCVGLTRIGLRSVSASVYCAHRHRPPGLCAWSTWTSIELSHPRAARVSSAPERNLPDDPDPIPGTRKKAVFSRDLRLRTHCTPLTPLPPQAQPACTQPPHHLVIASHTLDTRLAANSYRMHKPSIATTPSRNISSLQCHVSLLSAPMRSP